MEFTVPKFIEREARIAGPLTFKQLLILFITGAICFILYTILPFFTFLVISFILIPVGLALAFLKIGGRSFLVILANAFWFFFSPKIFVWKKKKTPVILKKIEVKKTGRELPLKVVEGSRLKKIKIKIETKTK